MKTGHAVCNNGAYLLTNDETQNGVRLSRCRAATLAPLDYHISPSATHSNGSRSITVTLAVVFVLVFQQNFLVAQSRNLDQSSATPSASEIEKVIEGLGSDDFLVRQLSNETLLEIGSSAIPQLRNAQISADQEVRYRASDILNKLLETDLEERANRFLALSPTSSNDCGYQHWSTFSRLAGTSREARALLVAIYSTPQSKKLLADIELAPSSTENTVADVNTKPFDDQSVTALVPVYAAEMYRRSMEPQATAPNQNSNLVGNGVIEELSASAFESNFLSLSPITVQQSEHKQAFLELLAAWLKFELQSTPMTVAKLKIIHTYRLKAFADDLAELLNQPQYPHKQAAIESLGKIFSPAGEDNQSLLENGASDLEAIRQLKPFVLSDEVLLRLPQAETVGPVDVTLGDFAIQLILNLQEKPLVDFGMYVAGGKMLFSTENVFCFKSRDRARASTQQWLTDFNESQKRKPSQSK